MKNLSYYGKILVDNMRLDKTSKLLALSIYFDYLLQYN